MGSVMNGNTDPRSAAPLSRALKSSLDLISICLAGLHLVLSMLPPALNVNSTS